MTTTQAPTSPPAPVEATDEARFVAQLRRLKTWSGRSFRELERRASAAGDTLPYSTTATMLGKNRLPRAELVETFVRACGLDGDDVRQWLAVRARIADGTATVPAVPQRGRRLAIAAAAGLAIAFAGGAVVAAGIGSESVDVEEIEINTP
jgi:hypothetical protein